MVHKPKKERSQDDKGAAGSQEEKKMAQNLYEVFIIRWSKPVKFPDGIVSNMACHKGPIEEARKYADEIAEKHGVTVEVIV